jgi:hypothetical protein
MIKAPIFGAFCLLCGYVFFADNLKDHLGNTRMTIHYDGSSSTAQVDQEDKLQNKLEKYHPLIRTNNK